MQQLTSFVVGLLFFMHALGEFTIHAHQGKKVLSVTGNGPSDQQEITEHGISIAGSRMVGLGGRKMVAHKVFRKLEPARAVGPNGDTRTTSTNSGKESAYACEETTKYDETDDLKLTEETRRLLKATREALNLMTKDYQGRDRRRKPPINNHEPQH
ncbi:uncharacterized protein LOC125474408 [Pyrus x bretschneideri]|uniref:uncharacterized protein LOC125474408 n=1 Tax=Pyrus x bretschneideri TaxID=225117 RepID=UPI00202F1057|nr:uncharacterized protein LOC125474408 [Pyrus x bretschneideri]